MKNTDILPMPLMLENVRLTADEGFMTEKSMAKK